MKILVAPLNWGLGHATRCVPLIERFLAQGDEVVLGGDGVSLQYLQQRFPQLRSIELAPLRLRYSSGKRQVFAMLIAIPKLIRFSLCDHRLLRRIQAQEHFDLILSDNRFGLYLTAQRSFSPKDGLSAQRSFSPKDGLSAAGGLSAQRSFSETVYITHQLHILLPRPYRWLEVFASRMHACIYKRYDEVWVPDTPDHRLSGTLSQSINSSFSRRRFNPSFKYIGPLSRFASLNFKLSTEGRNQTATFHTALPIVPLGAKNFKLSTLNSKKIVALYSGLEPHRTLFERAILERYKGHEEDVLLVNGKLDNQLSDSELAYYLTHAEKIIARSGYSTIMDLDALGVLDCAELIPTPGQPEQEYLAQRHSRLHH